MTSSSGSNLDAAPTVAGTLAAHVASLRHEQLPPVIIERAKLFMLDTLAVAWAGSDAPGCREVHALFAGDGGAPQSTAWAFGDRLPAGDAAFVNAATASALDYDSLGRDAPVHVNIVVLPAALAVAQWQRSSGRDFLCALVAGCDLMCRLGASVRPPHRGFAYTSVAGALGAAAASARLLGLDAIGTRHALGLAFLQAAGTQQANIEPTLAKRLLSAFPARAGILAARLAAQGLTAPSEVFEGAFGFYQLYQPGDPARLLDQLGERFDSDALSIKRFPSCGCNHTAIEATLQLVERHRLLPAQVESIEVLVSPYIDRIVGGPYDPTDDPQVAAQFSIRYSIACALVRRRLGLAEIEADAARDPAILEQVPKVSVQVEPGWTGGRGPVRVRIRTAHLGVVEQQVDHVPGSDEAPLTQAQMDDKFAECFGRGVRPLDANGQARLRERIVALADIDDMGGFFDGIAV
jgi:2-methylcitrate dehydratase PrpD